MVKMYREMTFYGSAVFERKIGHKHILCRKVLLFYNLGIINKDTFVS